MTDRHPDSLASTSRSPARGPGAQPRSGSGGLAWLLLIPLACCGGPLIVAGLATAGAWAWGGLGAAVGVAIAAVLLIVRSRRRRVCCATDDKPSPGADPTLRPRR